MTRRGLRAEPCGGFTVVELSVAMALGTIVLAALVAVIYSFGQNAVDQGQQAELQREARTIMADLVSGLRQAVGAAPNEHPVESLTADQIVFYTDQHEFEGPERVVFERRDCLGEYCQLAVSRYAAVAGSGPSWEFSEVPFEDSFLLALVRFDEPLFRGVHWQGDPKTRVYVSSCGVVSAPSCTMPMVAITLRVEPIGTSEGARYTFELIEEVTLRNAP